GRGRAGGGLAERATERRGPTRAPMRPGKDRRFTAARAIACSLLLVSLAGRSPALASDYDEQRARTAVRLFRSLLAADLDIDRKARPDGTLLVVFFGGQGA